MGQALTDPPVQLHQHVEEFDERGFDLAADLEHDFSSSIWDHLLNKSHFLGKILSP